MELTTAPQQAQSAEIIQPPFIDGLQLVHTTTPNIDLSYAYEQILGYRAFDELKELIKPLRGVKVAHVNATAYGGGVAELLHSQIPLMNQLGQDIGFQNDWFVMNVSNPAFYDVTKNVHNMLQGKAGELTEEEQDLYKRTQEENYSNGRLNDYDVVFIHDPQPAGLIELYKEHRKANWIWRCHIDTSNPNEKVWDFIRHYVKQYEAVVFTREQFIQDKNLFKLVKLIPPSIDPLSPKNSDIHPEEVEAIIQRFKIDPCRPIMVQVSRFDPWKQPLQVIEIYQQLKKEFSGLQLVLAGSMATDDPEGMYFWERTLRKAGEDPDIHILTNYHGVGNKEINAFQRGADVLIQYSSREGFGLTVSEGMWKHQPMIGGKVGGIQDQIVHGETGYLVSTDDEVLEACRELLGDPKRKKEMGEQARKRVAEHFLITREVADYLKLFTEVRS